MKNIDFQDETNANASSWNILTWFPNCPHDEPNANFFQHNENWADVLDVGYVLYGIGTWRIKHVICL